jgi:5-methylcytosine-specific restriction endonuclease McrA
VIEPGLSWRLIWSEGLRDCYICGIACDISDYRLIMNRAGRSQKICGPTHPSLDHITPLAKGGGHARDNTGLCCMQCNRRKHSKMDYDPKRV